MNEHASFADITFTENGYVDLAQLNALYRDIGWDSQKRRTEAETTEMLRVSHYYIAAHTAEGTLVGFARVCGDPYVAQVLDVITHPDYRRRGIATRCMRGVLGHLQRSHYVSVTLTDGSGIAGFYQRFGFQVCKDVAQRWVRGAQDINRETDSEGASAPEQRGPQSMLPRPTTECKPLDRATAKAPGLTKARS
jgi:GNAT superfamily N-acetyltransferase